MFFTQLSANFFLFFVYLFGVIFNRRNILIILMLIQLMFFNLNFISLYIYLEFIYFFLRSIFLNLDNFFIMLDFVIELIFSFIFLCMGSRWIIVAIETEIIDHKTLFFYLSGRFKLFITLFSFFIRLTISYLSV